MSRDQISGTNGDREMFTFPSSADHEQDWQLYSVAPYSAERSHNICIHTSYHGCIDKDPIFTVSVLYQHTSNPYTVLLYNLHINRGVAVVVQGRLRTLT